MSMDSSSATNDSLQLHDSSTNSSFPEYLYCFIISPSSFIFIGFNITYTILLLPLSIFILYHGLQQWWKKQSSSSAATSHTDSFTYHTAIIELVGVLGCLISFCGIYKEDLNILSVGIPVASFILNGETLFYVLTCVERYLAVVHPIIYLSLRNERGIRIRNISIGCVWLLCFVGMGSLMIENLFTFMDLSLLISAITIVSFCSVSVLCVLIRPGPGEQVGDRERVDPIKQRAFYTIVTILGVLVLRFAWGLTRATIYLINNSNNCIIMISVFWFYLPSSLALPVLFLHRRGKLLCKKWHPSSPGGPQGMPGAAIPHDQDTHNRSQ
ncbi:uncharacterized protein LOC121639785 [Melanotaenia boesemani]|uniref:uncharacterized protein LOC121639785 n=1 Tax=Melanotaenia boesemani TaxID=1250792 RepID=UPI001C058544|nr:uncharacterized protein LOC121639785 [Melanotaenia boesemani]